MPTPKDPTKDPNIEAEGAAIRIDEAVATIQAPVKALAKANVSQRQHIRFIGWVLAVDVLLTILGGGLFFKVNQAASQARAALVASCEAGNEFKRLDLERWNYIINLSASGAPTQNQTPAQKEQAAANLRAFKQFLALADAQRPCPK